MSKFTVQIEFLSDATREEVEGWAAEAVKVAPEGSHVTVRREPLTLEAEEVNQHHIGHEVEFYANGQWVRGPLSAVYRAGTNGTSVALVVHDVVWIMNYGVVQVTDW